MAEPAGGKAYRNKLAEFLKVYGNPKTDFSASPLAPKTIEVPSYLSAMRKLNIKPIDLRAGIRT
jgi:hypothetical protein